jgi:hypothetical protein
LKKPYHLSYPFVFQWGEDWYMLPESAANRTVELYRCIHFPDEWAFQHNLLEDVEAYDSTLVEHGGRWWLFANVRAHRAASSWDELHLFHSDSPISRNMDGALRKSRRFRRDLRETGWTAVRGQWPPDSPLAEFLKTLWTCPSIQ